MRGALHRHRDIGRMFYRSTYDMVAVLDTIADGETTGKQPENSLFQARYSHANARHRPADSIDSS
jgi:hypothetical protein